MYSLLGPSRNHPDASYVWNRWKGINSISEEIIDVSEEYSGGEGVDEYR